MQQALIPIHRITEQEKSIMNIYFNKNIRTIIWYITATLCVMIFPFQLIAQERALEIDDALLHTHIKVGSTPKFLEFQSNSVNSIDSTISILTNIFDLNHSDSIAVISYRESSPSSTRYKLQQYHNGIAVKGATFFLHRKEGHGVSRANGFLVGGLDSRMHPTSFNSYSEELIIEKGINLYANELANVEPGKPDFVAHMGRKIVCDRADLTSNPMDYYDCFEVFVNYDTGRDIGATLYIDVLTGRIIKATPISTSTCTAGSGTTLFDGTQTFNTENTSYGYRLYADCIGTFNGKIHTQNYHWLSDKDVYNSTTTWSNNDDAYSAHWAGEQTMLYFWQTHGRRSYDGASSGSGKTLDLTVNYPFEDNNGNPIPNAAWFSAPFLTDYIKLGAGGATWNDVVSLDVLGHEFTHAVVDNEADFDYEGESGALDEGFSDIFGELIELFATGTNDWEIGSQVSITGNAFRNLANPILTGDPWEFGGTNWLDPNCNPTANNDYCGVHRNATVLGHWFFLLSTGGTVMTGIGTADAGAIAYRALTTYLSEESTFADARSATVWAASDLFGDCSFQLLQTAEAWDLVDVFASANTDATVCSTTISENATINQSGTLFYNAAACGPVTVTSTGNLTTYAGNMIVFTPGFTASSGSTMHGYISCAHRLNKVSMPIKDEEPELHETVSNQLAVMLSPNPISFAHPKIRLTVTGGTGKTLKFSLLNQLGEVLQSNEFSHNPRSGENQHHITLQSHAAGAYFVTIECGTERTISPLVIYP